MIFSTWFGYFEYVGYLPCGIMLFVLNVLIWSLSTSTGLSDWSIIQREISSMKLPPLVAHSTRRGTFNHTWHFIHTPHKSFLCFSCIFTFLEIIKHNMPKILLFSSTFNSKMATQKFTNFDKFFFKCTLIWQLSQYNLVAQMVKNRPAMRETQLQPLSWEVHLENGIATHSSIHAWRIPWTEKPGRR